MKCWTIIKETKFLLMQLAVVLLNSFVGEDDEGVFPCCFVLATPWLDIALAQNLPITKDSIVRIFCHFLFLSTISIMSDRSNGAILPSNKNFPKTSFICLFRYDYEQ